jgi:hypothetical protein
MMCDASRLSLITSGRFRLFATSPHLFLPMLDFSVYQPVVPTSHWAGQLVRKCTSCGTHSSICLTF